MVGLWDLVGFVVGFWGGVFICICLLVTITVLVCLADWIIGFD